MKGLLAIALSAWWADRRAAVFSPYEHELIAFVFCEVPANANRPALLGKRPVFGSIGRKFVRGQAERYSCLLREQQRRTFKLHVMVD